MALSDFLKSRNKIAVVGISKDTHKWGYKIYNKLKTAGFRVFSVNPKYEKIDGDRCYPNLESINERVDVVVTVVPPHVTEEIVLQCKKLGINKVWMQPGSESDKAIRFCHDNEIEVVAKTCFVNDGLGEQFD